MERRITMSEGGCWLWEGGLDKDGYGKVTVGGRTWAVHILMRQLFYGAEGGIKHHSCRTKRCCNPEHVEASWRDEHVKMHEEEINAGRGNGGTKPEVRRERRKSHQARTTIGRPPKNRRPAGVEVELVF
jgi:hypothetical protein